MKIKILLLCIVLLAALLRMYHLGSNPPSLSWDEVAWGYNGYSLSVDLRDEFGVFLPFTYIESFGDFKPPVYAYLDSIPVALFGLTAFAARFPSAFFGTLTILVTYFLTLRIFYNSPYKKIIALLSAFLLAISPWHINLSRAAFEANVASFFIISGVWLFLGWVQGQKWYLIFSAVMFALSIYTFNTARIVSPLLVLLLAVAFWKQLYNRKKEVIVGSIVGLVLILPTVPFLVSPQAGLRFKEVNIFTNLEVIERTNQEIANDQGKKWSKVVHHRYATYGAEFVKHYLDHFNPTFLFLSGDGNPRFSTQDVGQLYLWDLIFLVGGVLLLIRNKEGNWWLLPLWLLIGIIPAATARETPHALRIETTLPTWQIYIAYGVTQLLIALRKIKFLNMRFAIVCALFFTLFVNVLYYLHGYYTHYPREYSSEWQYGYQDAVAYVNRVSSQYDRIYVTEALGRPYIYFLFYGKVSPHEFRQTADVTRDVFGFVHVNSFGKYTFTKDITADKNTKKTLYIASPQEVPGGATVLKEFALLNGNTSLVAFTLNSNE